MNTFVGRQEELRQFNDLLKKKTASLVVVKGRRRVGKSRLIKEFIQGKKALTFRGLAPNKQTTAQKQRDEFARQLSQNTGLPEVSLDDWSKLFSLLASTAQSGQVIIVFDEISWMGSEDSSFTAKLKDIWDEQLKNNPKLILVLCGSISTWIDKNIINNTGFYGRVSWTITLEQLPLNNANALLSLQGFKGSSYERFKLLSVTGGVPWYIEQMQGAYCADDNIKRQCFTKGGVLVDEYDRIFKEMFGDKDIVYKNIIFALSQTPLEYAAIAEKIDYKSSGRLSEYLDNLISAGFIARDYTWSFSTGKQSPISQFRLSDNYLRFYLKYVHDKRQQIDRGHFIDFSISALPGWESILGLQFENLVVNNRQLVLDRLNINVNSIVYDNPYIQRTTKLMQGCQIDYLIQTTFNNLYLCEVKFSQKPIGSSVINEIKEKIKRLKFPKSTAVLPVLIHVNGVTEAVEKSEFFYSVIDFNDIL